MNPTETTITFAVVAALASVLSTWLAMRKQGESIEASLVGNYSKLVESLQGEITRLSSKIDILDGQVLRLQTTIRDRVAALETEEQRLQGVITKLEDIISNLSKSNGIETEIAQLRVVISELGTTVERLNKRGY